MGDKVDAFAVAFALKKDSMQNRTTVARLVKVAAAFASNRGATIRELSEQLGVSTKTLYRDRDFLRDRLGLQIELEVIETPWRDNGLDYRHVAKNADVVLPAINLMERIAL